MLKLMVQDMLQPVGRLLVFMKAPDAAGSHTDIVWLVRPVGASACIHVHHFSLAAQAEVGWRRPARMRGVRWLESSGNDSRELAAIESIQTSQPLWEIARGREFEATVDRPTILGATDTDGDPCILKVIEVRTLSSLSIEQYSLSCQAHEQSAVCTVATLYSGEAPAMLGALSIGGRMSTLPSLLLKFLADPTCCL